ncbi:MAG: glucose 1-dehydrogenase [Actinobacteria bacterium]|nr:glucose 1-dehydrogenase [Actinomycetota bacterium]
MQDERVVVVTGGGSGMGRAMVQEFVAQGDRVAAVGRTREKVEATVAELDDPGRALAIEADVSDPEAVARCVGAVLDWSGRIDVLCNNAGIIDSYRPAHEVPLEEWDENIAVNLTGPFLMARAVLPDMLSRSAGVIINVASTASFSAATGGTAYTAAKHGVLGLTRQLTFDYGKLGIRVNAICPGATLTGLAEAMLADQGDDVPDVEEELRRFPAGRWCEPREIARLATYLASDDAAFIHGSPLVIDGGWLTAARNPL